MPRKITTEQKEINELTEFLQNKYSAFLSPEQVHIECLIETPTLAKWRCLKMHMSFVRLGKGKGSPVMYSAHTVAKFMLRHRVDVPEMIYHSPDTSKKA